MARFTTLYSGSSGNSALVEENGRYLLVDMGKSCRMTQNALKGLGLPEGWTRYGADGEEILSSHRYRALGNAIALPCAEYIMAGITEALTKGGANDGI